MTLQIHARTQESDWYEQQKTANYLNPFFQTSCDYYSLNHWITNFLGNVSCCVIINTYVICPTYLANTLQDLRMNSFKTTVMTMYFKISVTKFKNFSYLYNWNLQRGRFFKFYFEIDSQSVPKALYFTPKVLSLVWLKFQIYSFLVRVECWKYQ